MIRINLFNDPKLRSFMLMRIMRGSSSVVMIDDCLSPFSILSPLLRFTEAFDWSVGLFVAGRSLPIPLIAKIELIDRYKSILLIH